MQNKIAFQSSDGIEWAWKSLGVKRKEFRNRLHKSLFGQNDSREEIMNKCPQGISQDQWNSFVDYRLRERSIVMFDLFIHSYSLINIASLTCLFVTCRK